MDFGCWLKMKNTDSLQKKSFTFPFPHKQRGVAAMFVMTVHA